MQTSAVFKAGQDDRGTFTRLITDGRLPDGTKLSSIKEELVTVSQPGVLRGLHFQHRPAQGKWIQCLSGHVWDVLVDLRKGLATYGQWKSFDLKFDGPILHAPAGFAHGFCVLSDEPAVLLYRFQTPYVASGESAIRWNDPQLNITWPNRQPILSDRDQHAASFKDYDSSATARAPWWEGKSNG